MSRLVETEKAVQAVEAIADRNKMNASEYHAFLESVIEELEARRDAAKEDLSNG